MFETIRNAWKVAEIRKKLLFTLLIITIKFLEKDKAEHIADSLKQRINEIVEEERANGQ